MSEMKKMTIEDFAGALSSDEPVPGGGGASGLVAALGMSLGNMVLSLTSGKKKYAQYQDEIDESAKKAAVLTDKLLDSIDRDAKAFEPLSKAYGLPKGTEEEAKKRDEVMEEALLTASMAPLEQMDLIIDAMMLIQRIAQIGSRLAISDAGAGIQLCNGALNASSLNVFINTKLMKNRAVANDLNDRTDKLLAEGRVIFEETYKTVLLKIKGEE